MESRGEFANLEKTSKNVTPYRVTASRGKRVTGFSRKGPQDTDAIKVMAKFLDGLGAEKIILQTDGENAIQSLARQMAKEAIPTVTLRTTPRYSHQSNGRVGA